MGFRILTENDIKKLITVSEAISVNREAFKKAHLAQIPPRLILSIDNERVNKGSTLFKPAFSGEVVGCKIVSVRPDLAQEGKPTISGFLTMINERTGELEALMDANYLTALRTAAGSAVATDLMTPQRVESLLIWGLGMQGNLHIQTIICVRPSIKTVYLVNRTNSKCEKAKEEFSKMYPKVQFIACTSPEEINNAISKTDIICTCTNSYEPLFKGILPKEGCHLNAIGSFSPDMNEFDSDFVNRSQILIDTESAVNVGELKSFKTKRNFTLLGEALNKGLQTSSKGCTIFKSVGTALQDIETAHFILKKAEQQKIGQVMNF